MQSTRTECFLPTYCCASCQKYKVGEDSIFCQIAQTTNNKDWKFLSSPAMRVNGGTRHSEKRCNSTLSREEGVPQRMLPESLFGLGRPLQFGCNHGGSVSSLYCSVPGLSSVRASAHFNFYLFKHLCELIDGPFWPLLSPVSLTSTISHSSILARVYHCKSIHAAQAVVLHVCNWIAVSELAFYVPLCFWLFFSFTMLYCQYLPIIPGVHHH